MKIYVIADVPNDLGKAWLQHARDFDVAHPGCHFQIIGDTDASLFDIKAMVAGITPGFDYQTILERAKAVRLSEDERQLLLKLIDIYIPHLMGRVGGAEYVSLVALRRKIGGTDKRVLVEGSS